MLHSRACALAIAIAVAFSARAEEREPAVIVTATRFADTNSSIPGSISVITREDIRRAPGLALPELLKNQTALEMRPLYGPLGIDATVDVRGFGETAQSNTLVLLDGQRLNPIGLDSINWSAIPLEAIERIEIIRGSGTVMFGDRASGGVVNIVTDKSGAPRASAAVSLGQYGYKALDGFRSGGRDNLYYTVSGHYAQTGGYRQNSQQDERSLSGRAGLSLAAGEAFVDYGLYKSSNGLPGALTRAQFDRDPRMSTSLDTFQERSGFRLRPGMARDITDNLKLEAELGTEDDDSRFRSPTFTLDRDRRTVSFTPRLRWQHALAGLAGKSTLGLDIYQGEVEGRSFSTFSGNNRQTASQDSVALYAQNTTFLTHALAATAGIRHQRMRQKAADQASGVSGDTTRSLNAYDIGLSYDWSAAARVYGKLGKTFRFASTDELFGFDPVTFAPLFRGDLRPQHGPIREIGGDWHRGTLRFGASLYQLDLRDEINFNSVSGNNENFPATRRRGLELEARWEISRSVQARIGYARTSAKFTEGAFAGNWVPLVPYDKANAALNWNAGAWGSYALSLNRVGSRYYGSDLANTFGRLSGYTSADIQGSWTLAEWKLSARLLNAFNRKYAPFAGVSFAGALFYYPADPRTLIVSARYDFR